MAIHKATDGDLAGHTVVDINMQKFVNFKQRCYAAVAAGQLTYGYGAKDPHPGSGEIDFTAIDCSGFVRTLIDYASDMATSAMPDGSWNEGDWFAAQGFKPESDYSGALLSDGHIRVWVHHQHGRGGDPFGHVWLTINGHTVESCGGYGPHEQPSSVYEGIWDVGYVVC